MEEYRPLEKYYRTYTYMLKKKFGGRVTRISLDGGFSCPNRDGSKGTGGCIFCSNKSFSPVSGTRKSLKEQIHDVWDNIKHPEKYAGFISYFQPYTNTYAPAERLRELYSEAVSEEGCIGLAIGTRPDCVSEEALDIIGETAGDKFVTIELGVQSVYGKSLEWIRRGHDFKAFEDAAERIKKRGFSLAVHMILGIPGETKEMMLEGAEIISSYPIDIIKIHQLQVVKDTPLEKLYLSNPYPMWDAEEYSDFITDYIEHIRDGILIQRLFSRVIYGETVAPDWNRKNLIDSINAKLESKNIRQGSKFRLHETPLKHMLPTVIIQ